MWFIGCLGRAITSAEHSLQAVLNKGKIWERLQPYTVNERQRTVLKRMMSADFEGYMNTSKYAKLANYSTGSALRDINFFLPNTYLSVTSHLAAYL